MRTIKKAALAVFKDSKILLVRSLKKGEIFYTLGGQIKIRESDLDCLKREVFEEVSCRIDENSIHFLNEFLGPAHGSGSSLLNIRLYGGKLIGEPKVSSEVFEIGYFDSSDKNHLSEIAQNQIFPWLKKNGFIN